MKWFEKLTVAREKARFKQSELAKQIGVQPSTLSRWERGEGTPSMFQINDIANVLGVSLEYLIRDDVSEPGQQFTASNQTKLLNEDLAINSLVQSLGHKEALRRLTFNPAVDALINPDLTQVAVTLGMPGGPVQLNTPGMLVIGAFVVGNTMRVFYDTPEGLREFGQDLIGLSERAEAISQLDHQRNIDHQEYGKRLSKIRKKHQDGAIDLEGYIRDLKALNETYEDKEAEIRKAEQDVYQSAVDSTRSGEGDGPKKRVS